MDESTSAKPLHRRLPPEVIREILSFFSGWRWGLLNFALVSHDWLFESRPLLFRSIDLWQGRADPFVSKVFHSERPRPWLPSIHNLAFTEYENFVIDISERLSNLRTMKWGIVYFPYGHDFRPEVFTAFSKFARLHHLELVACSFTSFGDLKKVVVSLPALSSLTLSGVGWYPSTGPDESLSALAPAHARPALSKVSVYSRWGKYRQSVDDILLWLSTTPTQYLLRELSVDLCNIGTALRLMAHTSLAVLHVRMDDDDGLLESPTRIAALRRLKFSQVGDIDLLCLHVSLDSWDHVALILGLFSLAASVRRVRLCCCSGSYLPRDRDAPEFSGASVQQLDTALAIGSPGSGASESRAGAAFRSLRAVEFAWFFEDRDSVLEEQQPLLAAWARDALPRLHERCAVEVFCYNDDRVFGPAGLDVHDYEADFPHAEWWD